MKLRHTLALHFAIATAVAGCSESSKPSEPSETFVANEDASFTPPPTSQMQTSEQGSICSSTIYTLTNSKSQNGIVAGLAPVGPYPRARHRSPVDGEKVYECRFQGQKITWRSAAGESEQFGNWSDETEGLYATFEISGPTTTITVHNSDGSTIVDSITKSQR